MDTQLADWIKDTPEGKTAETILRKCVHCGFCLATCPTYQILGDELDSPRGRIYLIKQVLEGKEATRQTQQHLDRCLTCRNCETTCPSGVQYGHLVDIGRKVVDDQVQRPKQEQLQRDGLKYLMSNKALFDTGMKIGKSVRQFLPGALQKKVPQAKSMKKPVIGSHTRKVFILDGCVQPGMMPTIDEATMLVLDRLGVQAVVAPKSGCCGAVKFHLNDHDGARTQMRANIDAWWPQIEKGEVEALVMNASGCGVTVREYGFYLENDPAYADKAKKISELTVDIGEFLAREADLSALTSIVADGIQANRVPAKIAYHPPCTLQHGQQVKGVVEKVLTDCGFELVPVQDSHLCCGSAGTYSVLQPKLANELKKRKLANLMSNGPQAIASSNIGCLAHLESDAQVEVRHWIEWVARAID